MIQRRCTRTKPMLALPSARPCEFIELVEIAPLRGNPLAVPVQTILAVEAAVAAHQRGIDGMLERFLVGRAQIERDAGLHDGLLAVWSRLCCGPGLRRSVTFQPRR